MGYQFKVSFEYVNHIRHPQHYRGERPCIAAAEVPDEHWTRVESQCEMVIRHYMRLLNLIREGELIRDVRIYRAQIPDPDWQEITTWRAG